MDDYVLAKMRRAAELCNEGETALAHNHLAHADVPPCGPDHALRLFVADELLEAVTLAGVDANNLHHIFNDPRHTLDGLVSEFGSQESAFEAIAEAPRDAVRSQGITGEYKIQVEVGGHLVTVKGRVYNGIVNIGTVYIPWTP